MRKLIDNNHNVANNLIDVPKASGVVSDIRKQVLAKYGKVTKETVEKYKNECGEQPPHFFTKKYLTFWRRADVRPAPKFYYTTPPHILSRKIA